MELLRVYNLMANAENPAVVLRADQADVLRSAVLPELELPLVEIFRTS